MSIIPNLKTEKRKPKVKENEKAVALPTKPAMIVLLGLLFTFIVIYALTMFQETLTNQNMAIVLEQSQKTSTADSTRVIEFFIKDSMAREASRSNLVNDIAQMLKIVMPTALGAMLTYSALKASKPPKK